MDLAPYVDSLREELAVAAEAGGEQARAVAERLTAPLEASVRLTILEALSAAAAEITRDLAPGAVDLRLRGRDPSFVVTPPTDQAREHADPAPRLPPVPESEGGTARINFRLGENLKARIEEAAGRAGLSVNAWLGRAAAAALETDDRPRSFPARAPRGGERYTGWVR